jgi:hypothetical protein
MLMGFIFIANNSFCQTNTFESGLPHIVNYTKNEHKAQTYDDYVHNNTDICLCYMTVNATIAIL